VTRVIARAAADAVCAGSVAERSVVGILDVCTSDQGVPQILNR